MLTCSTKKRLKWSSQIWRRKLGEWNVSSSGEECAQPWEAEGSLVSYYEKVSMTLARDLSLQRRENPNYNGLRREW